VQIYRDTNCNGVLGGADGVTEITGSGFVVSPGQQLCIIVKSTSLRRRRSTRRT
jgi:hypothetical protein